LGSKATSKKSKNASILPEIENKYLLWGSYFVFMILIFSVTSHKIEDDDFFWHLSTGKFISENGYVPDRDVFGYTSPDTKWIPFEWGSDLLFYKLYHLSGYTGVYVFRSLIFCFIFIILFRLFDKFKVNTSISLLFSFLLLIGLFNRYSPRPHLFTYLFLTLLLYLLLSYRYINRDKYFKRLYALPVLFLLWGNMHPGVITGLIVLFLFLLSEFFTYRFPGKSGSRDQTAISVDSLKKLVILCAVSALVLLLNPHGYNTYVYVYEHTNMKMLENIAEWLSPFSDKINPTFVITLYKVILFASLIVLYYAYKKKDLLFALLTLFFGVYSVTAIRFTADFELIVIPLLVICTGILMQNLHNTSLRKIIQGNPVKIVLILLFSYLAVQFQRDEFYISIQYNREAGLGISNRYFPLGLYKFTKDNNIQGIPFNNFDTGGYMKWEKPDQKIFIDSRNLSDELYNEYNSILKMQPGFEAKLEKYGINQVIFFEPMLTRFPNTIKQNITEFLFHNKDWVLVYFDDLSFLFLKRTPENAEVINKYAYTVFNPYTALFNMPQFNSEVKNSPLAAQNEAKRKLVEEPNGYFFSGMNGMLKQILKQ